MSSSDFSIFEQKKALCEFHTMATQATIECVADDLYVNKRDSDVLMRFAELVEIFSNSHDDTLDRFFVGAIRRRDAVFINLVADVMHNPSSGLANIGYRTKVSEIVSGNAKPALRSV